MSIDYNFYIPGSITAGELAHRAFPAQDETPSGEGKLLTSDLRTRYGFTAMVLARKFGYFEVAADNGRYEWEADQYTSLTFAMSDADPRGQMTAMAGAVSRVLATGTENAFLTFTAGYLLLARVDGVISKYNRSQWWDFYPEMNESIPG